MPKGLAFSEFQGYETWELVSASHPVGGEGGSETLNVILGNPAMIKAYAAGIPGNGKPVPDGAKLAKIQYNVKKSTEAPFNVAVPNTLKDVAFMVRRRRAGGCRLRGGCCVDGETAATKYRETTAR